jgi:hypothetical protein
METVITSRKRLVMLGASVGFAAVAALGPMGTRAAGVSLDALVFHTSPAASIVCWVGNVCAGETGQYTFNTASGACTGFDDGKTGTCSVSSSGAFTSIVCGTGTVLPGSSSATIKESDGDTVSVTSLKITFVAGLGVVQATANEGSGGKPAVGVVQIAPSQLMAPKPTAAGRGVCTTGFSVESVAATQA